GALARQGRVVKQLLHPVVPVRRDAAGRLLALDPPEGGAPESMMRITLSAQPAAMLPGQARTAPDDWAGLEAALVRALADVRLAVGDFDGMAAALRAAERELEAAPAGAEPGGPAFLRWLAEDNFVLLGHRRLAL